MTDIAPAPPRTRTAQENNGDSSDATAPRLLGAPGLMAQALCWRESVVGPPDSDALYKEWKHFCIRLPGPLAGHLVVNFSLADMMVGDGVVRTPRMIALACHDSSASGWVGLVRAFEGPEVAGRAGSPDLQLAGNRLRWSADGFRLTLDEPALGAELLLRPCTPPTVASRLSLGPHHALHWSVLPRLEASGRVRLGRRELVLDRALAYHDHNWGQFRWGGDLSWEWGFLNPEDVRCPWSAVFLRICDGARHRVLNQGLLLWRDGRLMRSFGNREMQLTLQGSHDLDRPFTLPATAALLVPGSASGVPARLQLAARGPGAEVNLDFASATRARVALPSDSDDMRLVLLNEVAGPARAIGRIAGEPFDLQGPTLVEVVRG